MRYKSNWSFFTMYKFSWTERMVGISLGVVGLLVGLVQGAYQMDNSRLGEQKSIYYGLAFYAVGMLLFAFASEGWMMFVFLVPYCCLGRNLRTGFYSLSSRKVFLPMNRESFRSINEFNECYIHYRTSDDD